MPYHRFNNFIFLIGLVLLFHQSAFSQNNLYDKFWNTVDTSPKKSILLIDSLISSYDTYSSFEMGEAFFGKGYAHYEASEYQKSVEAYLEAVPIFKAIGDTCYLKRTYFNLGSSFNMAGDFVSASSYYLKYMG